MGRLLFLAENDQISNVNDGDDFEPIVDGHQDGHWPLIMSELTNDFLASEIWIGRLDSDQMAVSQK